MGTSNENKTFMAQRLGHGDHSLESAMVKLKIKLYSDLFMQNVNNQMQNIRPYVFNKINIPYIYVTIVHDGIWQFIFEWKLFHF